ncbi:MAG: hypothetical protein ACOYYS_18730 [Chloroflexota bacterium]
MDITTVTRPETLGQTKVQVLGFTYKVDFGPAVQPRFHIVGKDRACGCTLGANCPAVEAVRAYLREGGERAPNPMPPCPVCGAATCRDRRWDGRHTQEPGWSCTQGGVSHFLQAKAERIRARLATDEKHWLFPPVVERNGQQRFARGGIQPGDIVLYAGVTRDAACDPAFLAAAHERLVRSEVAAQAGTSPCPACLLASEAA